MATATYNSLVEILGHEATEKLIAQFGGRRVYIPVRLPANSPLADHLGHDAGTLLCAHFGGDCLQVPVNSLQRQLQRLGADGLSARAIAERLQCSERWVFHVLRQPPC